MPDTHVDDRRRAQQDPPANAAPQLSFSDPSVSQAPVPVWPGLVFAAKDFGGTFFSDHQTSSLWLDHPLVEDSQLHSQLHQSHQLGELESSNTFDSDYSEQTADWSDVDELFWNEEATAAFSSLA